MMALLVLGFRKLENFNDNKIIKYIFINFIIQYLTYKYYNFVIFFINYVNLIFYIFFYTKKLQKINEFFCLFIINFFFII